MSAILNSMPFESKISHFGVFLFESITLEENPILDIKIYKNNIAIIRSSGPIELWKVQKNYFYFLKSLSLPSNFIPEICCWADQRLFFGGLTGHILESDYVYNIINGNSGSIWSLRPDKANRYLAAGTEDGSVLLYDILKDNLSDQIKFIHKIKPVTKVSGNERTNSLAWSLGFNIQLAFSTSHFPINENDGDIMSSGQKSDTLKHSWNSGKLFIWNLNFLKQDENDIKKQDLQQYKVIDLSFISKEENFTNVPQNNFTKTSLFITALNFLDENSIVTGDTYGYIRIWNIFTCNLMQNFLVHKSSILTLTIEKEILEESCTSFYASGIDPIIVQFEKTATQDTWQKSNERNLHSNDVKALAHSKSWLVSGGLDSKLVFSRFPPKTIVDIPYFTQRPDEVCSFSNTVSCLNNSDGVNFIWKTYLLYKYIHHLELWEISKSIVKNSKKNDTEEEVGNTLNSIQLADVVDQNEGNTDSFKSTKLLELRTNRKNSEDDITGFLDIISASLSEDGKFLAYADQNNTHLYSIEFDEMGKIKLRKITLTNGNLKKTFKKLKKKKNTATADKQLQIRMLSRHLHLLQLPKMYFAKDRRMGDGNEEFLTESNNELVLDEDPFNNVKSAVTAPLTNNNKNKRKVNSKPDTVIIKEKEGYYNHHHPCLFRVGTKSQIHIYPIILLESDASNITTHKELSEESYYTCDFSRKLTLPPAFPEDTSNDQNLQVCAFQFKLSSSASTNNSSSQQSKSPPSEAAADDLLALSFFAGTIAVFSLSQRKLLWRLERNKCPCFILRFHPTVPEILLLYPDNQIHEYNYYDGEPTPWSTMFNSTYVTVRAPDCTIKKVRNCEKFALPWNAKTYKKLNKRNLHGENDETTLIEMSGTDDNRRIKYSEETLKLTYPLIRDICFNPQNSDQLILNDLDTIYTISKRGCCLTSIESDGVNNFPAIQEIKKCKYILKMHMGASQDIIIVRAKPEALQTSMFPTMKKKRFGI